jgi:anti-sigma regulatory factor (Ser/Thr protein kinase)
MSPSRREKESPQQASGGPQQEPSLVRRLQLPAEPGSAQVARAFCREACRSWSMAGPGVGAVADIASELVDNAVVRAQGPVSLVLELRKTELEVSVWDDAPGVPHLRPYRAGVSERGLGLRLVKQLSSRWGWHEEDHGKRVWARVTLTESSDRRSRRR